MEMGNSIKVTKRLKVTEGGISAGEFQSHAHFKHNLSEWEELRVLNIKMA